MWSTIPLVRSARPTNELFTTNTHAFIRCCQQLVRLMHGSGHLDSIFSKKDPRFLKFPNFPLIMICFQCFCASQKSGFLSKNQISISKPLFFAVQFSPWLTKDSWALRTGTCKFSQRQSTDAKAHSIRRPPEGIMFTYENADYLKRTEHPPICGAVCGLNDNGSKTKSKLVHRDSTVKWPTREPFLYFSGLDKLQWFRFSNRALSD